MWIALISVLLLTQESRKLSVLIFTHTKQTRSSTGSSFILDSTFWLDSTLKIDPDHQTGLNSVCLSGPVCTPTRLDRIVPDRT